MASMFLLIPLSLMLFVVAIWAVRYAIKSNQFEDLDNASQRIILEDRQERRQVLQRQSNDSSASGTTSVTHSGEDNASVVPDHSKQQPPQ